MSEDQLKEWYPSSGNSERPEQDWKKIMGCSKTISCKECKDFKRTPSKETDRYVQTHPKRG